MFYQIKQVRDLTLLMYFYYQIKQVRDLTLLMYFYYQIMQVRIEALRCIIR